MYSYYFSPHYSGAALQALTLSQELGKYDMRPFLLSIDTGGLAEKERYHAFDIYRIKDGKGQKATELILWWNMLKFLIRHRSKYGIIHSHGAYYRNSIVGILGKLLNKKSLVKVSMANNDLKGLGEGLIGRLHGFLLRMVDRYISISSQITKEMIELLLDEKKIEEIPNGVDATRFSAVSLGEKKKLRKELGLPEGLMLLYIGGISQRKNVEWFAKAWAEICPQNPDSFLTLVGPIGRQGKDEMLYNSLAEFVGANSLEKQIIFKNPTSDIERYYQTADIFVLPSKNEGMPNVVLEAMASALPCLVNRISGATDLITNEETGLFFDADSTESFYRGFRYLKEHPERRAEIGRLARDKIVQEYSMEIIGKRYVDLYAKLLAK